MLSLTFDDLMFQSLLYCTVLYHPALYCTILHFLKNGLAPGCRRPPFWGVGLKVVGLYLTQPRPRFCTVVRVRANKKPLMCGLGVPVGCRMKHAKGMFKPPWGSAIACAVRRSEKLLHSLQGFKGFKGKRLRAGKRQAWTPIKGFQGFKGFEGI